MKNLNKNWIWLLLFGSLWGMSEVIAGGILFENDIPLASVWLGVWALFLLSVARGIWNQVGSSTTIGFFAVLFKLVNAAPFFCHLLGIFSLGLAFDVASSLLMKSDKRNAFRASLTGITSSYSGYALFALVITYIIRYSYWVEGGLSKVSHHIFVSGSVTALAAAGLVPLGLWIGINSARLTQRRSRWVYSGAFLATIVLWIFG